MNVNEIDEQNVWIKYRDPCVVMVGGVPGAGKTTMIERAIPNNAMLLSADNYRGRQQVLAGHRWEDYVPAAIPEARRKFLNDVKLMLSRRVPIFLDASYLTEHSQGEMQSLATLYGIPIYLLVVHASLQDCLKGVTNRERTVPKDLVRGFYGDYLRMRTRISEGVWSVPLESATFITRRASESVCIEV